MNSLVCIAYVPDTETRIKIAADGKSIDETDVKWIVSPYDEYALEEALRIKEAKGAGTVTVIAVGPERAKTGLRECLARGADEAVWVDSSGVGYLDAFGTARALASVAKGGSYDFVWLGQKGVGYDESLVGPMLAELAGLPHVANVVKVEYGEGQITAHREIEGAHEIVECALPCVLTAQKGLNEPRYASLKGIMAAKKKPIDVKDAAALALDAAALAPRATLVALELPPSRQAVRMIEGDADTQVKELLRLLHEEAKVI
jgi:electron transfer flavoprotein beta subunit